MKNDIEQLRNFAERGALVQFEWGDARETACLMSALTGETSIGGCVAQDWPQWLAELGTVIFDNAPEDQVFERSIAFSQAVNAAEARGADFGRVFRDIRLDSVLPIAMESVRNGNEPWRVACREAVQWSIDHDGAANPYARRDAEAAKAAKAAKAEWAAGAVGAAGAAEAAKGAGASAAAKSAVTSSITGAAWAAWAAAHTRIYESTIKCLRGDAV